MSRIDASLYKLEGMIGAAYWSDRIYGQLRFGKRLSDHLGGKYYDLLLEVTDGLIKEIGENGCITPDMAKAAEEKISVMSAEAKSFKLLCVSHAHIDMNWMWHFEETVSLTIDTFRTMLKLMEEYPDFKYSQSQASVYKIIADYGTEEMLREIAGRIREGRWEITASTWVEADKNMPNAESMARHLLYTRKYLSKLFDIAPERLNLDFEPDTFGHSANIPELLSAAGVKYYYHTRGSDDPALLWWHSPSGEKVLCYNDISATHYNFIVDYRLADEVLNICGKDGIDTAMRVYGVGDHGGGPTRRDLDRIIDMMSWPVYPTLQFGTYQAFFSTIEKKFGHLIGSRSGEMNYIFSGCYTSQSRIKMSNRIGEATLNEAEMFSAFAGVETGLPYPTGKFEKAWRKILFNQFHDIITGSGLIDTREYALGEFQKVMAASNTAKTAALRAIAAKIDTSKYIHEINKDNTFAQGAGAGSGSAQFRVSQSDIGYGKTRLYHFFNSSQIERTEVVELTVWDWPDSELALMEFTDMHGNVVPYSMVCNTTQNYWGHNFINILIRVTLPAYGYTTYKLSESKDRVNEIIWRRASDGRLEDAHEYHLENAYVYIGFNKHTGAIEKYIDKKSGENLIDGSKFCGFRFIEEDTDRGMEAWIVGRHMNIKQFDSVHLYNVYYSNDEMRRALGIDFKFGRSSLNAVMYLDHDSKVLRYDVKCDWQEAGQKGCMPQLSFILPLKHASKTFKCDIPGGIAVRDEIDMDIPAVSFIASMPEQSAAGLMLSTDTKYGYRCYDNALSVNLIRSSIMPDPYPEYGVHQFKIAVQPIDTALNHELAVESYRLWHPINVISAMPHAGTLPACGAFLNAAGAFVQAVKLSEDNKGDYIIRLCQTEGTDGTAVLEFTKEIENAYLCDIHENTIKTLDFSGKELKISIGHHAVLTVRIALRDK